MKVIPFTYCGFFDLYANTYVLVDDNDDAIIIDPGKEDASLISFLKESQITPKAIFLTHGHFDHIRGVDNLVKEFNIPVYINEKDQELLTNPHLNCSDRFSRTRVTVSSACNTFKDGDKFSILLEEIKVIETPYHTEGSSCFYLKDSGLLFSGDSLFKGSVGRSDFPTSNPLKMEASLRKILSLPEEVKIYPGHNEETTIKEERVSNQFVK